MVGARVLVVAGLLAGCGRLGFDARDAGGDGATLFDASMFTGSRVTYIKASNPVASDAFGGGIGVTADGTRFIVGAFQQGAASGAAYVFVRSGETWVEEAILKAAIADAGDQFARSMDISNDGMTVAIGANLEDSGSIDPSNNSLPGTGAAYIFVRTGTIWSQQAYLKASNPGASDNFGTSIALSGDGNTLVVGAYGEASATAADPADDSAPAAGAAYVFTRAGTTWTQRAYLKASNTESADRFGEDVAISADASTLAVSAPLEGSIAQGIGGDQLDNSAIEAGAVYVFARVGAAWQQHAYVKASNTALTDATGSYDQFGWSVSLSATGDTLAVGARLEASAATAINGDEQDDGAGGAGAVYVFTRTAGSWSQQAYIKAPNTTANDFFGESVGLSADGNTLAITAPFEDSGATGLGTAPADDSVPNSGAVYVLGRSGTTWSHRAFLKATNTQAGDSISAVGMSADATTIVLGAGDEDSGSAGVDANGLDNSASNSGAAYAYW
jgi:hypothetical protein